MLKNRVIKFIVFVVALQVMNMSIDMPASPRDVNAPKDYNYLDSYVEYIAEVVLKYQNAVPESKHRQQKEYRLHHHLQIICQAVQLLKPGTLVTQLLPKTLPVYSNRFAYQYINEVNPPPPRIA